MPGDVAFCAHGSRPYVRLRMRKRKDMRLLRGKHDEVLLPGGGAFVDPVAEMSEWVRRRPAVGLTDAQPLFCWPDGRSVTVTEVRSEVRRCMEAAGRDATLFGAHSLRIGAATAALSAGVPPERIRLMGRWSSDVYQIYCRMSFGAVLAVGDAIGSAQVTPTAPAFHEEHLELLATEVAEYGRAWSEMAGDEVYGAEEEEC